jgi:hypothetical protein
MDPSQFAVTAALALALYTGRPRPIVALAMVGNLFASMALGGQPIALAVADWVSIALLIGEGRRAAVIAALFLVMQPIYVAGHYLGLRHSVIYTLIDVIAFVQLSVLGGWDAGMGRLAGHLRGWRLRRSDPAINGANTASDMGRSVPMVSVDSGGLN